MTLKKELVFVLPNKPGTLGKVASALAAKGINLLAVDAAGGLDHNIVRLVPDKADQALQVLKKQKLDVGTGNVLCARLPDKSGSLRKLTSALGKAGINIEYLYATGGRVSNEALVVLRTSDNKKARQVLGRAF